MARLAMLRVRQAPPTSGGARLPPHSRAARTYTTPCGPGLRGRAPRAAFLLRSQGEGNEMAFPDQMLDLAFSLPILLLAVFGIPTGVDLLARQRQRHARTEA